MSSDAGGAGQEYAPDEVPTMSALPPLGKRTETAAIREPCVLYFRQIRRGGG